MDGPALFTTEGYDVVKNVLGVQARRSLVNQMFALAKSGMSIKGDGQVKLAYSFPNPPFEARLLRIFHSLIEKRSGLKLVQGHVFGRIYLKGAVLKRHKDRELCQCSASLCLGSDDNSIWPLYLRTPIGCDTEILLEPGDMVIFDGFNREHWREPLVGSWQAQLFLHYRLQSTSNLDLPYSIDK